MNVQAATDWQTREPAEPPAKLKKRLTGDLDNIVLKALCKEPARRYATVEQLAEFAAICKAYLSRRRRIRFAIA